MGLSAMVRTASSASTLSVSQVKSFVFGCRKEEKVEYMTSMKDTWAWIAR